MSFASPVTLGYTKNKGVYRLLVTAEGEWEDLTIRCFWHLPGGTDPASSLVQDGFVDVPASVTAQPGTGCITFEGSDGEKTVTSADLRYRVGSNSGTEDGTMPEPGAPAWEQLVGEVEKNTAAALEAVQKQIGDLNNLTTKAKENLVAAINEAAKTGSGPGGGGSITMRTDGGYIQYSKDDGETWENLIALSDLKGEPGEKGADGEPGADGAPGQNGADGAPGADGFSPTATVSETTYGARITITDKNGTTEAQVLNGKDGQNGADGQPGRDGTDGAPGRDGVDGQPGKDGTDGITPTIGANGNWFLGATDTGISAKGVKGNTGDKGEKGDTGPQGPQGPVGPQGPQGAAGPQGPAGKDGAGMDITGATVGQIAKISEVDEAGKPTAWEPVDMSGGLSSEWELVFHDEVPEDTALYKRDVDSNGNKFALTEAAVVILTKPFTDDTATAGRALGLQKNSYWGRTLTNITNILKKGNTATYDVVYAKVINGYHMCVLKGQSANSGNVFGMLNVVTSQSFPVAFETNIDMPFAVRNVKYPVFDAVVICGYTAKVVSAGTQIELYKRKG